MLSKARRVFFFFVCTEDMYVFFHCCVEDDFRIKTIKGTLCHFIQVHSSLVRPFIHGVLKVSLLACSSKVTTVSSTPLIMLGHP